MRRFLANLGLLAGTMLSILVALELGARFLLPPHPIYRHPQPYHDLDPAIGYRLRPSQRAWTHDKPVRINAQGLRDDEDVPFQKPAGELRVLVLGDSFTFGNGVEMSETYAEVLERSLQARGIRARVLNAGTQGWNTHQELVYLREHGLQFEPDVVVVGFFENDINPLPDDGRFRVPIGAEGNVKRPGWKGLFSDQIIYTVKRLRIVAFLLQRWQEIQWSWVENNPQAKLAEALFQGRMNDYTERGWRDVTASLAEMKRLARERGAELVVLVFPFAPQMPGAGDFPTEGYQGHLSRICADLGIELVDPLEAYAADTRAGRAPFIAFDGHPSVVGHATAGRLLIEPVARRLEAAAARAARQEPAVGSGPG